MSKWDTFITILMSLVAVFFMGMGFYVLIHFITKHW